MRRDYLALGLLVLGTGLILGAVETYVGNRALGNAIDGWLLVGIIAVGLGGTASLGVGVAVLFQSSARGSAHWTASPPTAPVRQRPFGDRVSWSAYAFLAVILILASVYVLLVLIVSGIGGILLQLVFWVPIIVVVLLLARWRSRTRSPVVMDHRRDE